MFIDSVTYLYENYWFVLLLALLIGFVVGWKSYASAS
ncbi:hypothetical protein MNBD_ALPHA11-993 [hydrothermal vent metagenome]|uniref:Uncharacterized protein n=1 Tax=hydrothermal vent metagenome TaxID=652676 RepID=A0A3B0TYE2_9ZZZZ